MQGRCTHGVTTVGGVTAGQARHTSSNLGGVTASQVGHNSSFDNPSLLILMKHEYGESVPILASGKGR